jgi:hypothetical protein
VRVGVGFPTQILFYGAFFPFGGVRVVFKPPDTNSFFFHGAFLNQLFPFGGVRVVVGILTQILKSQRPVLLRV